MADQFTDTHLVIVDYNMSSDSIVVEDLDVELGSILVQLSIDLELEKKSNIEDVE